MSKTITIVTGAHLCRNPRVVKEATALVEAGFRVTVVGPALHADLVPLDEEIVRSGGFTHEIAASLIDSTVERHWHRAVRRGAVEVNARLGLQRPEALGYGLRSTLKCAAELRADLTIGHQEVGLWVIERLARMGMRVGVDVEDWYSEDLLPEAWVGRPRQLLAVMERAVLKSASHVTSTSEAMSAALVGPEGGTSPLPIYNSFPAADRVAMDGRRLDRKSSALPSLYWVSQTVGPGRGLEELLAALRLVERPVQLHLRGACTAEERRRLESLMGEDSPHELHMHGLVPPQELLSRTAEHDIGLALELDSPPSRDVTVTNKVFHYLQAGLATIASETKGQEEVARLTSPAVRTFSRGSATDLARKIVGLIEDEWALSSAKEAAWDAGGGELSWERQAEKLVRSVEMAIADLD